MDSYEPDTRRRDTSWVRGELSHSIEQFPRSIQRIAIDKRYYLLSEDDFDTLLTEDLLSSRSYSESKFASQHIAPAIASRCRERWGVNGIGTIIDTSEASLYNIVVYEQGGVEILDPDTEVVQTIEPETLGPSMILL